jgi:hypothetical protein
MNVKTNEKSQMEKYVPMRCVYSEILYIVHLHLFYVFFMTMCFFRADPGGLAV